MNMEGMRQDNCACAFTLIRFASGSLRSSRNFRDLWFVNPNEHGKGAYMLESEKPQQHIQYYLISDSIWALYSCRLDSNLTLLTGNARRGSWSCTWGFPSVISRERWSNIWIRRQRRRREGIHTHIVMCMESKLLRRSPLRSLLNSSKLSRIISLAISLLPTTSSDSDCLWSLGENSCWVGTVWRGSHTYTHMTRLMGVNFVLLKLQERVHAAFVTHWI